MTDRRPTVAELHGLCDVGVRWRSLGIQLNLAPAKLDAINHENARVEDKLAAMYQLWMDKYPNGNRKDILNALRAIEENDIAVKYEGICKKEKTADTPAVPTENLVADSLKEMKNPFESDDDLAKKLFTLKDVFHQYLSKEVANAIQIDDAKAQLYEDFKSTLTNGCNNEFMKVYKSCVDKICSSEDLIKFLIDYNFSSYLNYQPLKKLGGDDCAPAVAVYEKLYNDLLSQVSLTHIASVFQKNLSLVPGGVFGFPTLQFQLTKPDSYASLCNWIELLPQSLPSHIANVHKINGHIIFTYSIYPPCSLPYLFTSIQDQNCAKDFQRHGVSVTLDSFNSCTLVAPVSTNDDGADDNNSLTKQELLVPMERTDSKKSSKESEVQNANQGPHVLLPMGIMDILAPDNGDLDYSTLEGLPLSHEIIKTILTDSKMKVKVQPMLLSFSGNGKTKAVEAFMNHYVKEIRGSNCLAVTEKCVPHGSIGDIAHYDLITLPLDDYKVFQAAEESSIAFGILSAFKNMIEFEKKVPILDHGAPPQTERFFEHVELNDHFMNTCRFINRQESIPESPELTENYARALQSPVFPESLGLVNIWDLASSNVVHHLLSALQGHLYNSYMWLFLDLDKDLDVIDEHYEMPAKDGTILIKTRPLLHFLLRLCWITEFNVNGKERNDVCTIFAAHERTSPGAAYDDILLLRNKARPVARHIGVSTLLDDKIQGINIETNHKRLYDKFQSIITDEIKFVEVPINWIFLRSLFYHCCKTFIPKRELKKLASQCNIDENDLDEFCKFYTSFASIVDLSLINSECQHVIVNPVTFLKSLDELFKHGEKFHQKYPTMSYGIVPESALREKFGDDQWMAVVDVLACLNLATRVPGHIEIPGFDVAINHNEMQCYIPLCCTGQLQVVPDPNSVHLITNIDTPHFFKNVSFVKELTKLLPEHILFPTQSLNEIAIKDLSTNTTITITSHVPVIKIHIDKPSEKICSLIVQATNRIASESPVTVKYKFVQYCTKSIIPNVESLPSAFYHVLPIATFCKDCRGVQEVNTLVTEWEKALETHQIPLKNKPTGELGPHELASIARKILKIIPENIGAPDIAKAFGDRDFDASTQTPIRALGITLMKWHESQVKASAVEPRRALAQMISELGNEIAENCNDEESKQEVWKNFDDLAEKVDVFFKKELQVKN